MVNEPAEGNVEQPVAASVEGLAVSPDVSAAGASPAPTKLWPSLLLYTALRLLLIAVLTLLLSLVMIPLAALAFAVVLQLPLAWMLFGKQRRAVNAAMAATRGADREQLRRALSGEN